MTLHDAAKELHDAVIALRDAAIKALRLESVASWLADRLPKSDA